MDCNKVLNSLSLLIDDRLSTLDSKQVKKHLSNCPDCREEYNALKEVSNLVGSLEEKNPPEGFSDRIMKECAKSDKYKPYRGINNIYYLKRAAVAAVIFFFLLGNSFIWAFTGDLMASDDNETDINIKVDMRLAGPNIQVRDVDPEDESGVQRSSSKEITNEAGRYKESDDSTGFWLSSLMEDYSSYLIFNGMYIPVAATILVLMKMKDKEGTD